jgi:hypothetical protein
MKPLWKWMLVVLGSLVIIYIVLSYVFHISGHPEYSHIQLMKYDCKGSGFMSCEIYSGDRYDLTMHNQNRMLEEKLSSCKDCVIKGKFVVPENDYPWLMVSMYLYSYESGSDGNQVSLFDYIVFFAEKGVTEVNFSMGEKANYDSAKDYELVTIAHYGYYRVLGGEYDGTGARGYGVPEDVVVKGYFVRPSMDLLYTHAEKEAMLANLRRELEAKLTTDMTQEEETYLKKYVTLEDFKHSSGSAEDGVFRRTISGKINNTGNKAIGLALLSVQYDNGEKRTYVIANGRAPYIYDSIIFHAKKETVFVKLANSIDFHEVDYNDLDVQAEINLQVVSANIEKIYFDW